MLLSVDKQLGYSLAAQPDFPDGTSARFLGGRATRILGKSTMMSFIVDGTAWGPSLGGSTVRIVYLSIFSGYTIWFLGERPTWVSQGEYGRRFSLSVEGHRVHSLGEAQPGFLCWEGIVVSRWKHHLDSSVVK